MTDRPFIEGFDLIALPRARRLARARRRHLWGWLAVGVCGGLLMLALDSVGAWRERAGAKDHGRYRAQLQARVLALAPAWREAGQLASSMDQAAARQKALMGVGDRRWALYALLDALARAATPGLALQRLHYHAEGQPQWPIALWPSGGDTARWPRNLSLSAPLGASDAKTIGERDADRTDVTGMPSARRDVPPEHGFASTPGGQGMADPVGANAAVAPAEAQETAAAETLFATQHRLRSDTLPVPDFDARAVFADVFTDAELRRVSPHTAPLALTVQGIADDEAVVQGWVARLQRDPRVAAVTVDAFVQEPGRPTPLVWGKQNPAGPATPSRSGLTRFRVSVYGRASTGGVLSDVRGEEGVTHGGDSLNDAGEPIGPARPARIARPRAPFEGGVTR